MSQGQEPYLEPAGSFKKNRFSCSAAASSQVITVHASEGRDFTPYLEAVLRPLSIECVSAEEGVRNMVAECLGALVTLHPDLLLPRLVAMAEKDPNDELMRWTVASALK